MANTKNFRQNVSIVSKLILAEKVKDQEAKNALLESGTPTTALPPSTNAIRQMQQDMALAAGKSGIPSGIGGPNPGEGNPAQMGPIDDEPAHDQPGPGKQVSGMQQPQDRRGTEGPIPGVPTQASPATGTQDLPPESNATRQLDQDVALAKAKGGIPRFESFDGLSDTEVVEAFIESVGGVDRATLLLIADGCPLALAEALVQNNLGQVNEAIREKLSDIFEMDIHQRAKSGNASSGFKKWYSDRVKKKSGGIDMSPNEGPNRDKPLAAFKREGPTARKNK